MCELNQLKTIQLFHFKTHIVRFDMVYGHFGPKTFRHHRKNQRHFGTKHSAEMSWVRSVRTLSDMINLQNLDLYGKYKAG